MTKQLDDLIDAHCKLQDVHFAMEKKYEKLLAFVRKISRPNIPDKTLRVMQEEGIGEPNRIIEAREILKEIGESHD